MARFRMPQVMRFKHTEPIRVVHAHTARHPYNSATFTYPRNTGESETINGCVIAPVSNSESSTVGRDQVHVKAQLFVPADAGVNIAPGDAVIALQSGVRYRVIGLPLERAPHPFTNWYPPKVYDLERSTG